MSNEIHYQNHLVKIDHVLLCDHGWQLTYRQDLKRRRMPYKIAKQLDTANIASTRNQWYSKDSVLWLAQMTLFVMA